MPGRKIRILVVEDSDLIAGVLTDFFTSAGHEVLRAINGVEGILAVYREIPDVIIMDVEMPALQGYQASRLLKARRGVRDIPIIMHTSLSEDRDEFWARSSGADAFITKDFDNLEPLGETVGRLGAHPPFTTEWIREDAPKMSPAYILEMLGTIVDQQLFQSTLQNELAAVASSISSITETVTRIFALMNKVCQHHVAVINLLYNKKVRVFISPSSDVYENDVEDFYRICLGDFHNSYPGATLRKPEKFTLGLDERTDYQKIRIDKKKIQSYTFFDLPGIGTIHLGNFINNYYSDAICANMVAFARSAATILENMLLLHHTNEMETSIRLVFSKFVPAEVIDDMIERGSTASMLSGEKRNVAILFSDIRSFTTIAEDNSPENVVAFLNTYFDTMGSIINQYGGIIDKFIGDAILAIFGAPQSFENNAERAVRAASQMLAALPTINPGKVKLPPKGFDIGIGIHEGDVIVGNIGSREKFDYTVIGDAVNLASRLEGLTKHYHAHLIVSQSVQDKLRHLLLFREIDSVRVKGKDIPTTIYKLEEARRHVFTDEVMQDYNKGMSMYKIGNWDTGITYFQNVLASVPDDYISRMYLERCIGYRDNPPGEGWDPTRALDFK
jgi:class 3 adenylate cyclase/CheY-like chemotaxis protein